MVTNYVVSVYDIKNYKSCFRFSRIKLKTGNWEIMNYEF